MALQAGSKAPDFKTKDQDGKEVTASGLKGKKYVLYFYPKDMTSGCTAEACNLRDNYSALQKAGYEIFGISRDDEKSHRKFIEKENLPFRLLADTDLSVHKKFGTWIEKSMYGRKYMGTARVTFKVDANGTIEDIIQKVDTRDHAAQILGGKSVTPKASAPKKSVKKVAAKAKPAKKKK
ncbi:MAG: thioredoxin-dependent thiol peroxidase [Cyclobacteriaceae bacterium]|nr:thioredoxin-dependent thiol peroxidase [Cyclobacteriaceae bacterium]